MDHSIYGYLSRWSNERLLQLINSYEDEPEDALDAEIKRIAEAVWAERMNKD